MSNKKRTIAIVEDDAALRKTLAESLKETGYATQCITDFKNAAQTIMDSKPDLALLDLGLPGVDGALIAHEIRSQKGGEDIPIIVLTSKTSEGDEIISMTMGADDFVTKPFSLQVLLAHIEAVMRRYSLHAPLTEMTYKALTFCPENGVIKRNDDQAVLATINSCCELTRNEQRILARLMKDQGSIVSRQALMSALWDSDAFVDDNALTVNVNRLRAAFEKIGLKHYIKTHRGMGYSLQESTSDPSEAP